MFAFPNMLLYLVILLLLAWGITGIAEKPVNRLNEQAADNPQRVASDPAHINAPPEQNASDTPSSAARSIDAGRLEAQSQAPLPLPPAKQTPEPAQAKRQNAVMGTWLWNTRLIRTSTREILDFISAKGVNAVYLQIDRDVELVYYKRFIREAGAGGIAVHALDGRASWGLSSGREQIKTYLNWVKSYQSEAGPGEKFTGLHVDIEPYSLPDWETNYVNYIPQWQENVNYLAAEAAAIKLPIAADLAFWLGNYLVPGNKETLSLWMLRKFKTANIMSYRDSAQGVADVAGKLLKEADFLGIPVTVSVETSQNAEGSHVTFYEEREAYMTEEIHKLPGLLTKHASFAGVAVSDYAGWRKLKK